MDMQNLLPSVQPFLSIQGQLCECPIWDARKQVLYWTDIDAGRLYSYDWHSRETQPIYEGPKVGGFTLQENGELLLFREKDVALRKQDGSVVSVRPFAEEGDVRFNDVCADPAGRVFAGTIGKTNDSGSLYQFETDGHYRRIISGTRIANGITFSRDLKTLYWVCSTRRKIFAFPYSQEKGIEGEPAVFFENGEGDGLPDGLTSDAEGNLYSIRWEADTYGILILDSDGKILGKIKVPAKCTTSATFCGPDLDCLVITTARKEGEHRVSDLFLLEKMPVRGREEFRSRF